MDIILDFNVGLWKGELSLLVFREVSSTWAWFVLTNKCCSECYKGFVKWHIVKKTIQLKHLLLQNNNVNIVERSSLYWKFTELLHNLSTKSLKQISTCFQYLQFDLSVLKSHCRFEHLNVHIYQLYTSANCKHYVNLYDQIFLEYM